MIGALRCKIVSVRGFHALLGPSLPVGSQQKTSNITVRICGCWQLTDVVYGFRRLTKKQPGTPGGLCQAQNLYRSVEGPQCESRAMTVLHSLILNLLLHHSSLRLRDLMSVCSENTYIRKL